MKTLTLGRKSLVGGTLVAAGFLVPDVAGEELAMPVPSREVRMVTIDLTGGDSRSSHWLYNNITTGTGFYMPQVSLGAVADDLHMVSGGLMTGFTFGYYDPTGGTALTDAIVNFYANDPADSLAPGAGAPLLAPFVLSGLPGDGLWLVTVITPPTVLTMDVWAELDTSPSSREAGLLTYDPPTTGYSDDLFAAGGSLWFFGGVPVANFAWEIVIPAPGGFAVLGLGGLAVGRRRRA